MSTLSEITQMGKEALEKIGLEAHFHCDPNQKENLLFLSPLLLLEDYDLKEGGYKDYGAKNILGRVTKDILRPDGDALLQVPEITYLHMGYGKKSKNKVGKMAITEEEAKLWKSFIDLSRFTRSPNTDAESAASGDHEGETLMEVDFPTPQDTQAHESQQVNSIEMVPSEMSGLKIPLKGRYILLFSILLIFFDKKKKKESVEGSDKEEAKIGANKISDFMLFWILPYLLSFNNRKVTEIIQHHQARRRDVFNGFVEMTTLDIIDESFAACEVPSELKERIIDKYKDYYGTEQLQCKYKLLKTVDNTPLILVPKRYIIKQMPAELDDIGKNWRELGNVTVLDEFMNIFVRSKPIQEDFLYSMKDLKGRQGIDYAILLPDEETFEELIGKLERESAEYLSTPKRLGRRGRSLISPRIGLVKNKVKNLTVCFSFVQGKKSQQVSALFRAIGAHYYDHFTLVVLHGLALYRHGADPHCRVGNLYPVAGARRIRFRGHFTDRQVKKEVEEDFSEAQGRFSKTEFPETFEMWEQTVQSDTAVKKVIEQTQNNLKVKPTFERCANCTVVYSTSSNACKLQCTPFGAALARNEKMLEGYKFRAVNLDGCLLSKLAKCGREGNTGVVLAIKEMCGEHGSCLPLEDLPDAIRMIITHFIRAVVVAGLPKVYPPESDDLQKDRDEIPDCPSSEEEEEDQEYSGLEAGSSGPSEVQATRPRGQVKPGVPQDEVLEALSRQIGKAWKPLGRRLKFDEAALIGFDKDNEEYSEKAYQMLLSWKQNKGSAATYQVLSDALCHPLVGKTSLAEQFCYD